jgi:hypothetical protein
MAVCIGMPTAVGVWGQASCLAYPSPSLTHRQFTGGSIYFCPPREGCQAQQEAASIAPADRQPNRRNACEVRPQQLQDLWAGVAELQVR